MTRKVFLAFDSQFGQRNCNATGQKVVFSIFQSFSQWQLIFFIVFIYRFFLFFIIFIFRFFLFFIIYINIFRFFLFINYYLFFCYLFYINMGKSWCYTSLFVIRTRLKVRNFNHTIFIWFLLNLTLSVVNKIPENIHRSKCITTISIIHILLNECSF